MGFDEPELAATPAELANDALVGGAQRLGGATLDDLRRERIAAVRFPGEGACIPFVTDFPTTPSGKVELCPPHLGPITYTPLDSAYPLTLLSPASSKTINSIFGEASSRPTTLDMHPDDAAGRGLADGETVRVFNQLGEVHVRLRVTDDVRAGVVALPKGLWRTATLNGATATALAPDHLTDIGDGACFNDARVEVERL
jgi:anaerobic selenocysteine-containing dehydrogenase